jgi:hypothetical protein
MIPPSCQLPVAPILQVSAITVRCAIDIDLCNTAMKHLLIKLAVLLFYSL